MCVVGSDWNRQERGSGVLVTSTSWLEAGYTMCSLKSQTSLKQFLKLRFNAKDKENQKYEAYIFYPHFSSLSHPETGDSKWGFNDKNQLFSMCVFLLVIEQNFPGIEAGVNHEVSCTPEGPTVKRKEPKTVHIKGKM